MLIQRWLYTLGAFNDICVATGLLIRFREMAVSKDKKKQADALTQIFISIVVVCFLMHAVFPGIPVNTEDQTSSNMNHTENGAPESSPMPTPSPDSPTPSPAVPTSSPAEPTPSPAEPTPSPAEPTPSPAEPTPGPAEPTPGPAEPTPSPAAPTPSPAVPTPSPAEPTPGPAEPTPTPAISTPSPAAPTPNPKPEEQNPGEIIKVEENDVGQDGVLVGSGNNEMNVEEEFEEDAVVPSDPETAGDYPEEDETNQEIDGTDVGANDTANEGSLRMPDCRGWSVASVKAYFNEIGILDIEFVADDNEYVPQDGDYIVSQSLENNCPIENEVLPIVFQIDLKEVETIPKN